MDQMILRIAPGAPAAAVTLDRALLQLGLGLLLSGVIGLVAYRRAALSLSGALGAVLTGTLIFGFGGWTWGMLLITFFTLSTLLSKYKARAKADLAEKFAKGSRRDLGQVLANGGAGALLALGYAWLDEPALFFAFAGAMATVNADTWATELGVLSRRPPRLITTGKVVDPGTSGGISGLGTLATLSGGLAIGLAALGYLSIDRMLGGAGWMSVASHAPGLTLVGAAMLGGLAGALFDSLLGATVQAIYFAPQRAKETEKPVDPDGTRNHLIRGWTWLNNDGVNFASSLVGAAVSSGFYYLLH